jgi:hypothetical protein
MPRSHAQRNDIVKSVINRNHRNQFRLQQPKRRITLSSFPHIGLIAVITVITHMKAFHQTGLTQELDPQTTGVAMQLPAAAEAFLSQRENVQGTQDHRVDYEISLINRN